MVLNPDNLESYITSFTTQPIALEALIPHASLPAWCICYWRGFLIAINEDAGYASCHSLEVPVSGIGNFTSAHWRDQRST
ncbi:Chitinase [Fusarium oxysporum f. sp. albedinis]|nr:Chitinase [Fusarium oxysporum f. sp. albedinis]